MLQWQSENEIDFSHYDIQRSADGIRFSPIGAIPGKGLSGKQDYTYTDRDPWRNISGKIFYRLQLVDKNGEQVYSKILSFDLEKNSQTLTTFPNPTVQYLTMTFDHTGEGNTTINIIDVNGRIVKNKTQHTNSGKASLTIDVSELVPAVYFVSVITESGVIRQKFIKN